jgi:sugar lactone lactonase YvrE
MIRRRNRMRWHMLVAFAGLVMMQSAAAALPELLYVTEGNRLRRYDLDTIERGPLLEEIVIRNAESDPQGGRDVNGTICRVPGAGGLLVMGEDTGQPNPPAGWGVFTGAGDQVGKLAAHAAAEQPDPYGCAFDRRGRLFTSETGRQGFFFGNGQLIEWFPPFNVYPGARGTYPKTDATSANYCKLATDLGTAAGVAVDGRDRVYVAASSGREILRFSPPFPTGPTAAGGCGAQDAAGAPMADSVAREQFVRAIWGQGLITYSGLAFAANGNLYAASVATGRIGEFNQEGEFVRLVLDPGHRLPPYETGYPMGLAVDSAGSLYYTDLDLEFNLFSVDTGSDGKVWRIRFDGQGAPRAPELVSRGLEFPDGLAVITGDLQEIADWPGSTVRAVAQQPKGVTPPSQTGPALVLFVVIVAVCGGALTLALRRRRPTRY